MCPPIVFGVVERSRTSTDEPTSGLQPGALPIGRPLLMFGDPLGRNPNKGVLRKPPGHVW